MLNLIYYSQEGLTMKKWKLLITAGIPGVLLLSFALNAQDEDYFLNHPEINSLIERFCLSSSIGMEYYPNPTIKFPDDPFHTLEIAVPAILKVTPLPLYHMEAAVGILKPTDSTVVLFSMKYDTPLNGMPAALEISWIEKIKFDQIEVKDITGFSITVGSGLSGERGKIQNRRGA
jgi:hypothetical protein